MYSSTKVHVGRYRLGFAQNYLPQRESSACQCASVPAAASYKNGRHSMSMTNGTTACSLNHINRRFMGRKSRAGGAGTRVDGLSATTESSHLYSLAKAYLATYLCT